MGGWQRIERSYMGKRQILVVRNGDDGPEGLALTATTNGNYHIYWIYQGDAPDFDPAGEEFAKAMRDMEGMRH